MTMTLEVAKRSVGELVRIGSRSNGRPHMGKLVEILGKDIGVVIPGGHKKREYVNLGKLSRWVKGEAEGAKHRTRAPIEDPNLLSASALVAMARPGEDLSASMATYWRRTGLIPKAAVSDDPGREGYLLYDLAKLRAAGFFEKVVVRVKRKPEETKPHVRLPEPASTPAAIEAPPAPAIPASQEPEPVAPLAGPTAPPVDGLDALAALERAIRDELDAELALLERRGLTAKARAAAELAKLRQGAAA